MYPLSDPNTHHDITDLKLREMVRNTSDSIFQDRNMTFLLKKNQPVPQIIHFEKLSFCSEDNL